MKLASHYIKNHSKNQSMPYSKICSTKILTLTIGQVLFILVDFSVNLLCSQICISLRKKRFILLFEGTDEHIMQQKGFILGLPLYYCG